MSLQPNPLSPPPAPAKGKGCFFYGCLTSIIIGIVLIVGIYIGFRYVVSKAVDQYTQAAPLQLSSLDSSTESYLKVKGKVESFQSAIKQGQAASLELTGAEINTYLSSHPGLEGITDNFRVSIVGSDLQGEVSVPLDDFGYPDRYFNGTMSIQVEMKSGALKVWLRGLKIGDTVLPDKLINEIGGDNMLDQIEPDKREKLLEVLAGVNSIVVQDGTIRMSGGGGSEKAV